MPPPPKEQFILKKAAGEQYGTGLPEPLAWAEKTINEIKQRPNEVKNRLKSATEIGDQSLLLKEKMDAEVEAIGKGTIDPETGEKDPKRTKIELDNMGKAETGSEITSIFFEYSKLDPKKDQKRMKLLEDRMILVLKARPSGEAFFTDPNGNQMKPDKQAEFVKRMLREDPQKLRSIALEQTQAFTENENRPSATTEQTLAALGRYKDAEFNKENAKIELQTATAEYEDILQTEKDFLEGGERSAKLKTLADGEPLRKAGIQEHDVRVQSLQQQLAQLNAEHGQLNRTIRTGWGGQVSQPPPRTDLEQLDTRIHEVGGELSAEIGLRETLKATQEEFEKLKKQKDDLPKEKAQREQAKRKAQSEQIKADATFKARSEEYRMAVRLKEATESYYADALNHLPDHIINTYLDGKIDEVTKHIEEAIPYVDEQLRQKMINTLDTEHYEEKLQFLSWKWQPFFRRREFAKTQTIDTDWNCVVSGAGLDARVQGLVGTSEEWKALTPEQQNGARATYVLEVAKRYIKMRENRFIRHKIFGQQIITDYEFRKLKQQPWNDLVMEASLQANQPFKDAVAQKLPGVDVSSPDGKAQLKNALQKDNNLYAIMMALAISPSLFQGKRQENQ